MQKKKTLKERLEGKYKITPNGCWQWTAFIHPITKYGIIRINYKHMQANRVSYEAHIGKIPGGMFVCHKCDFPACINPEHLFLGTQDDNNKDRDKKGRRNDSRRPHLTREQVLEIRKEIKETTQQKLAAKYGISLVTLQRVLSGRNYSRYA